MMLRKAGWAAALLLGCAWWVPVAANDVAGEITLVTGLGTSTALDGSVRKLARGDAVYSGEILNSGPNSYVNIKFRDGALMLLRPNTRFAIEEYSYDSEAVKTENVAVVDKPVAEATPAVSPAAVPDTAPTPAETTPPKKQRVATPQRAFFRLVKGGFRTITGLIGKANQEDYRVTTPTATIGIRGTEWIVWICDAACAKDPMVNAALRQAFGENFDPSQVEVIGTLKGRIEVTNTETGQTEIVTRGEYILSTPQGDIPLPGEPPFIARDRMPDPKTCQ